MGNFVTSSREMLNNGVSCITDDQFIKQHVYPMLNGTRPKSGDEFTCQSTVVQNTGTGRLTLRYDFGDDCIVYAKLYTDGLGAHSYHVLKMLWEGGFGQRSRYQVSPPLAFLPEFNLLLMRGVAGAHLGTALRPDSSIDLVEGSREAARWLATFHRSSLRFGEPEIDWDSLKIFRICVRLIKAAAALPEQSAQLLELMHLLKDRIKKMPAQRPIVQTHGRYHHEHVYLSDDVISVIDMDRSRPSDPAKDVAEFVRVLRIAVFKSDGDMARADAATNAFLEEYLAQVPEAVAGLAYHWSSFILLSLFGFMKRLKKDDPRRQRLIDFHVGEMERVMEYAT